LYEMVPLLCWSCSPGSWVVLCRLYRVGRSTRAVRCRFYQVRRSTRAARPTQSALGSRDRGLPSTIWHPVVVHTSHRDIPPLPINKNTHYAFKHVSKYGVLRARVAVMRLLFVCMSTASRSCCEGFVQARQQSSTGAKQKPKPHYHHIHCLWFGWNASVVDVYVFQKLSTLLFDEPS